jgi:rhamnose transport system permease protein
VTRLRRFASELLLVVLIVLAAIASSAMSPYFLDPANLLNAAQFFVIFALMAFGLFPIVVQGEIDISLASTLAIGSVLFATLAVSGVPLVAAVALVLLGTALLGVVNGVLVGYGGLPSLAVTLGTLGAYRGIAYLFAGDAGVTGLTKDYTFLGMSWVGIVPSTVVLFLIAAVVIGIVMETTTFGRYSYAIGANPDASRSASVPVRQVRVGAYAIAGAMAGLAGFVWVNQYQSARGDNADGAILFVLTAVVLGGVSIKGGSGRALGVLLSTLLLATIQTGMKLANVPGTSQTLVIGVLLIASIGGPQLVNLLRAAVARLRPTAPVGG